MTERERRSDRNALFSHSFHGLMLKIEFCWTGFVFFFLFFLFLFSSWSLRLPISVCIAWKCVLHWDCSNSTASPVGSLCFSTASFKSHSLLLSSFTPTPLVILLWLWLWFSVDKTSTRRLGLLVLSPSLSLSFLSCILILVLVVLQYLSFSRTVSRLVFREFFRCLKQFSSPSCSAHSRLFSVYSFTPGVRSSSSSSSCSLFLALNFFLFNNKNRHILLIPSQVESDYNNFLDQDKWTNSDQSLYILYSINKLRIINSFQRFNPKQTFCKESSSCVEKIRLI